MLMHDLSRLRQALESPRLSALQSTLGLAVPRAALQSLEGRTTGEAQPDDAWTGVDRGGESRVR